MSTAYYALASQDAQGRRTVSPRIPSFPVDDAARISLADINRRAAAVHGGIVAVHRTYVAYGSGRLEKVLFVGEMLGDQARPLDVKSPADLKELSIDDAWIKRSLSKYLEPAQSADEDVEWYRPGWFRTAVEQLTALLTRSGLQLRDYPEQYRCGRESALIRVVTSRGTVFCKKVAPGRARELPITALLRWVLPDYIPRLLEKGLDHGWLISFEDGYGPLSDSPNFDDRVRAAQAYARFQLAAAPYHERLIDVGVLDWTPQRIQKEAGDLYERIGLLVPRSKRQAWQSHFERFSQACRRLIDLRLPPILQHEDVHAANVVVSEDGVRFLDWAYVSVGTPVFSASGLLHPPGAWPSTDNADATLNDAYLRELCPAFSTDAVADIRARHKQFGPFGSLIEAQRQYITGRIDRVGYKARLSQTLWKEGTKEKTE
jgi:hypothetical protein